MLVRTSLKFQRQYNANVEKRNAAVQPFPYTWNVDLFNYGRNRLVVLASEEYSLFSLIIVVSRSCQLEIFLDVFRQRLLQLFENIQLWDHPDVSQIAFSGRTDRRIIGSQNDLLFLTRSYLEDINIPISTEALALVEEKINSTPMSYLDRDSPLEALGKQRGKLVRR